MRAQGHMAAAPLQSVGIRPCNSLPGSSKPPPAAPEAASVDPSGEKREKKEENPTHPPTPQGGAKAGSSSTPTCSPRTRLSTPLPGSRQRAPSWADTLQPVLDLRLPGAPSSATQAGLTAALAPGEASRAPPSSGAGPCLSREPAWHPVSKSKQRWGAGVWEQSPAQPRAQPRAMDFAGSIFPGPCGGLQGHQPGHPRPPTLRNPCGIDGLAGEARRGVDGATG